MKIMAFNGSPRKNKWNTVTLLEKDEEKTMKFSKIIYVTISLLMSLTVFRLGVIAVEASEFKSNLTLGTEIDAGHGKVEITKVSEAMKTPIYAKSTNAQGNKFIIIDTVVSSIVTDSKLESIAFSLVTNKRVRFDMPSAYGKVKVFDKLQNFEATDGAVVYAYNKGDALNLFFEVPQSIHLNDLRLVYVSQKD